jgi:hypothetical protein
MVLYNVFCRINKRAQISPDFYVPMTIRLGSNIFMFDLVTDKSQILHIWTN